MQVRGGASMPDALLKVPPHLRAGCQALGFHVMRWRGSAEAARAALVPRKPAPEVDALLTCALALMWPMEAPPYTAHTLVDEAVKCAARMAPHGKGFVNAVLRNALRQGASLQQQVLKGPEGRHNHPAWWVRRLERDWPQQAHAIMQASQVHPPMTLRAHARHGGLKALAPALESAGLGWLAPALPQSAMASGAQAPSLSQAAALERALPVDQIPGFAQGHWSVQDAAAQLAAPLLIHGLGARLGGLGPRPRVLDACAAPGGKTAHLLEIADLDLWALDADAQRLERVRENLQRLQLPWPEGGGQVALNAADARDVKNWWDGQPFDAVLLDAPCSASGIVRRHPDIRWLRRPDDLPRLAATQRELLEALWPTLAPGGRLLYATCSVFRLEGQDATDAFLQRLGPQGALIDPASPGHLLPLPDNIPSAPTAEPAGLPEAAAAETGDGFFYALLHKP